MPNLNYPYSIVSGDTPIAARVQGNFDAIKTLLESTKLGQDNFQNDSVGVPQLASDVDALLASLGANIGGNVASGKSIIPTEEIRSNTAYGLMTTPDRVQSVVMPTNGRIRVSFQAMVKNSVSNAGRVALFIGSNQHKVAADGGLQVQETKVKTANTYYAVGSFPGGLAFSGSGPYPGDATTGQAVGVGSSTGLAVSFFIGTTEVTSDGFVGGACEIFAAAGTYDISVQFKASSGTITAKERKLWVEAKG